MLIPVRCYTCGKVVGDKWEHYNDLLSQGKKESEAFEIIGLKRYCCKRVLMGHVDVIDILMGYDLTNKNLLQNIVNKVEAESKEDEINLFSV
jgi:DNA-directed RNA polymerase I, II, and III subunit RPABC5